MTTQLIQMPVPLAFEPSAVQTRLTSIRSVYMTVGLVLTLLIKVDAAEAHSYPWHVALAKKGLVKCSGTLIHESWVLTSGNCKMRQTTVYAGVSNLVQYGGIGVQSRDIGRLDYRY